MTHRILVVDDNHDTADSLTLMLQLSGHVVATAYDGKRAAEMVKSFRPDVALLDIGMPDVDGYDTARLIRELPEGKDIVLVAVTGWSGEEEAQRSRAAGFDRHIVKPVSLAALESWLATLQGSTSH